MNVTTRSHIWFWSLASVVVLAFSAVAAFQIYVDPFGIWGGKLRPGINNAKMGQLNMERIFKPYQFDRVRPSVVFIGTSRINYGMPAVWPNTPKDKVYNFGLGALPMNELEQYINFFASRSHVRTVILGLDVVQFNAQAKDRWVAGFSKERIEALSGNCPLSGFIYKLKETMFCFDAISKAKKTMEVSERNKKAKYYNDRGWFVHRGEVQGTLKREYRHFVWRYTNMYFRISNYNKDSFSIFKRSIARLKKKGINVVVFTTPYSGDLLLALRANKKWRDLEMIKKKVSRVVPLWDFAYPNSVTMDRYSYSDASHYRGHVGKMIVDRISHPPNKVLPDVPEDFGVLLTKKNVKEELAQMRSGLDTWVKKNDALFNEMKSAVKHKNKIRFQRATNKFFTIPSLSGKSSKVAAKPVTPPTPSPSKKNVPLVTPPNGLTPLAKKNTATAPKRTPASHASNAKP